MKIIHFLFVSYVYYTLLCRINNLKLLIMKNFSINAETKGIRNSEKRANEKRHTYFCEPRMKTFFKKLSDAIKKVAFIKANGWDSLFVIVFENNEYRIAFKTDNKNNVVWSE